MARDRVILIDGNSLAHRAFWALPDLKTSGGVPTSAIHGFLAMMLRLVQGERPGYLAVAFDRAEPTFRHVEYEGYKAQRAGSPEEFRMQVPLLKEVLLSLGVPVFEKEGYEADDILGKLAREGSRAGLGVLIVTGDRDALQLVDEDVHVVLTRRGITDLVRYDREAMEREFGITPAQVPDVKGLMGDASDNIPGVPGIGEKIAYRLIRRWGSLDAVLEHAGEVEENRRVREALLTHREQALLSRKLATIDADVPLEVDLEACRWRPADLERAEELFQRLELRSVWQKLLEVLDREGSPAGSGGTVSIPAGGGGTVSVPAGTGGAVPAPGGQGGVEPEQDLSRGREAVVGAVGEGLPEAEAVASARELEEVWPSFLEACRRGTLGIAAHLEGSPAVRASLVGLALAAPGRVLYVPLATDGQGLSWDEIRGQLTGLLADESVPKSGHDLKSLLVWLLGKGVRPRGVTFDTVLAAYLLDPTRSTYPVTQLAHQFLGRKVPSREDVLGKGKQAVSFRSLDVRTAASLLGGKAACCRDVITPLRAELEAAGLGRLMDEVEMPLLPVLAEMERVGVRLDLERVRELADDFGRRIEAVAREVHRLAGCTFNINSTQQLQEVLFDKLGLPAKHRTKTGYSTSAEALEELRAVHPVVEKILEHRTLVKLKGTYLDGMPALVNPATGRVHTTFNQVVTATGRLSSNDPNLQNIPVRDELGRRIRQVFIPEEGWLLLSGDYSQIELRLLAHVSGDPGLVEAFRNGEDIHRRTASEVFGVPLDGVTAEMRSRAKAVNFGIVYGISDFGLAQQLGIGRGEAREYITSYFLRYPGVRRWIDEVLGTARTQGFVTTLMGRRRQLPTILSRNPQERGFAERTAINTPLQGSAADIIKLAMVNLHRELSRRGMRARIILQVHDELILEAPRQELDDAARLVRSCMEKVMDLAVPLVVDLSAGPTWYDLSPL
ncbi:MAG: DNA polymerase I [Bacillota bacterium]